jgi:hypothetical protein
MRLILFQLVTNRRPGGGFRRGTRSKAETTVLPKTARAINRARFRLYLFQTRKLGDEYEVLFGHG